MPDTNCCYLIHLFFILQLERSHTGWKQHLWVWKSEVGDVWFLTNWPYKLIDFERTTNWSLSTPIGKHINST